MLGGFRGGSPSSAWRSRTGNVTLIFAFSSAVLLASVGLAIDGAAWLRARSITLRAIDAAVLAGSKQLFIGAGDVASAVEVARQLYTENVRDRQQVTSDTIEFNVVDGTAMIATGTVGFETSVLKVLGIREVELIADPGLELSRGIITLGANANRNLEIALVLDVSRAGAPMLAALSEASRDFARLLLWAEQSIYSIRIAVIPFAQGVRAGAVTPDWVGTSPRATVRLADGSSSRWVASVCVAERIGMDAASDASPRIAIDFPRIFTPNGDCATASDILPLTSDRLLLDELLSRLSAGGESAPHVGLAWGWYTLSPRWSPIWPRGSTPFPYVSLEGDARSESAKFIVFASASGLDTQFCDGSASAVTGGAAIPDQASAQIANLKGLCLSAGGSSADQALKLCSGIKTTGIKLVTIALAPISRFYLGVLRECASGTEYFYAANEDKDLRQTFRDIATRIVSVRLAR